jgi:hypothetical protein
VHRSYSCSKSQITESDFKDVVMHYFTPRRAGHFLLVAFGGMIIFHLLTIRGTLPTSLIWGGGATPDNAIGLELIAIGVIALFIFVIANNLGYIKPLFPRLMRWSMWLFVAICASTPSAI